MRTAAVVAVAYLLAVVVSSVWRLLPAPVSTVLVPDVVALTAAYLGLTARGPVAPAMAGAVVLGYLADLISGAPPGLLALTAALSTLLAHGVHRRLLVRGATMTVAFAVFVGVASSLLLLLLRVSHGLRGAAAGVELTRVAGVGLATGLLGPVVLGLYRRIDAAFARTGRERDAALEGLAP
ncbi:MAG: hypothetical protein KBG28_25055 [Kofleriaceae bacterium]|jgi:cell shape-determining protein MreD|nr:hypothetical protein [Kofleriaceae bacterium]MBP6839045.1 hypothetical protein [Kofleriaceae bacterium]MBP9207262.1 hypothetical protein [Kofleriaceae bacterium]